MTGALRWLGIELDEVAWREKIVSGLGGFVALGLVLLVSHDVLGGDGARMVVASMGASAVLLFAVPHGALSQPWPVLGGHVLSALVGVACARAIGDVELAAAVAVGVAVFVMHATKCIHPPGGATALTAVVGGAGVRSLGYGFVVRPVLLNVVTILAVAVLFNGLFPWRRYPSVLARRRTSPAVAAERAPTHDDVVAALREIGSFVDITEEDLAHLYRMLAAREHGTVEPPSR